MSHISRTGLKQEKTHTHRPEEKHGEFCNKPLKNPIVEAELDEGYEKYNSLSLLKSVLLFRGKTQAVRNSGGALRPFFSQDKYVLQVENRFGTGIMPPGNVRTGNVETRNQWVDGTLSDVRNIVPSFAKPRRSRASSEIKLKISYPTPDLRTKRATMNWTYKQS